MAARLQPARQKRRGEGIGDFAVQSSAMKLFYLMLLFALCASCGKPMVGNVAPAPEIAITDRQVIESDGMSNTTPAVVQAANGDWVLSYLKGTAVILRRSQDQATTWSPEQKYFDTSTLDPSLGVMPDGSMLIEFVKRQTSTISGSAYSLSTDDGMTFGTFTFLSNPANLTAAATALMTVGGTVYLSAWGPYGDGTFDASLWDSTDSGQTWAKVSTLRQTGDDGINETAIADLGNGRFIAVSRADHSVNTFVHFSEDSGISWSSQINYVSQIGVLQDPQLLKLPTALLLFGRELGANQPPHNMVVYASYDGGSTFVDRTVLDTYTGNPTQGGYCWPLLRADGKVFVVYYADSNNLSEPDIKSLVLQWNKTGP